MVGLLTVEGFLLLSQWGDWFSFNQHKGWTVVMAVAAVGLTLLVLLLWLVGALLSHFYRFQFGYRSLLLLMVTMSSINEYL